jgi:hypothetical protein
MQNKISNTEDVDQIIKEELLKQDDMTIQYKTTKDYQRVEVEHGLNEVPDPRIHGAKIIFDSRLDKYTKKDEMQERLSQLSKKPVFVKPAESTDEQQFEDQDEEFEEETKSGFRKQSQAESNDGEEEDREEAVRKVQQMVIGFKREMVEKGVEGGLLDFVLQKFFDILGDKMMTEKEVAQFLEFLKEFIGRIKNEFKQKKE